jgi:hypothetical protein
MRMLLLGVLPAAVTFFAPAVPTQSAARSLAGKLITGVSGFEYMDPEFLQQLGALATSFTLGEGEQKTLELKLKRRP